ncbi:Hypothetical protein PHPALM_3298 [Phytophthora palmivora]|uniref:Uncharacterized protein n=1 Tax=Phytophthora palmivora TaxID=4796 RepID=A0A2P4YMQ5_9STRA|nr:Hypothetical protein PHPALM_3298 [Phytophthora palmivora]
MQIVTALGLLCLSDIRCLVFEAPEEELLLDKLTLPSLGVGLGGTFERLAQQHLLATEFEADDTPNDQMDVPGTGENNEVTNWLHNMIDEVINAGFEPTMVWLTNSEGWYLSTLTYFESASVVTRLPTFNHRSAPAGAQSYRSGVRWYPEVRRQFLCEYIRELEEAGLVKGKPLTRNTAMQYYRQAKLWLLDQFPQHRAALEARLLKMGKTLNNFCLKRDGGGFISKAPPCSKADLKKMLVYLYVNASCSSDYQDAALICLLWYLFSRASDLALLRKPNISIDAGNVLFVRFFRMKTSENQGLSLFPGTEFETCPMFAMALAMLMQTALSMDVIDNIPGIAITLSPDVPLLDILDHPADTTELGAPSAAGVEKTPTVYSHVNRVPDRIAAAAGVTAAHKSHSFRRGGAQHANGSGELTARCIFDRGTWNTSTTNKGFNYSFNTSKEDHMVGKILSGHDTDTTPDSDLDETSEILERVSRQFIMLEVC